jgi:hypothetical protein
MVGEIETALLCVGGPADGQYYKIRNTQLSIEQLTRAFNPYSDSVEQLVPLKTTNYTYYKTRLFGMTLLLGSEWANSPEFPHNVLARLCAGYRVIKQA